MIIRHRRDLGKIVTVQGDSAEIGVAEGFFSADILSWSNCLLLRHFMVDRWESVPGMKGDSANSQAWHDKNFGEAQLRVAKFGKRAVFLRGDSVKMAKYVPDGSLALLYLDGDHSYMGVMADLLAWVPKVKKGGCIGCHDFQNPSYGVKEAVTGFCKLHGFDLQLLPEDKMEDAGCYFIVT
jgi:hypothetical protein